MSTELFKERFMAILDGMREKVVASFDEGKAPNWEIEAAMASYRLHGITRCVPTGEQTYIITIPGVLDDEAIAIAKERRHIECKDQVGDPV